MLIERWAAVAVAPDYDVSDRGRVRRRDTGRTLALTSRADGYVSVLLSVRPREKKRFYVHRLVASAFIGDLPDDMDVNHINFIRHENRRENLEIVTRLENAAHSKRAGRLAVIGRNAPRGEASCRSKLTLAEVLRIRKLAGDGIRKAQISRLFRISKNQVSNIVTRKSWRDAPSAGVSLGC